MYLIQKLNLKLPSAMLLQSYFIQLFLKHVQYFTISLVSIYDSWALNNTAESVLLTWYWIAHLSLYDSPESLWLMRKFCSHETELLTWAYMIFWASLTHESILLTWYKIAHLSLYGSAKPQWLMRQYCSRDWKTHLSMYYSPNSIMFTWASITHPLTNNLFIIQWVQ